MSEHMHNPAPGAPLETESSRRAFLKMVWTALGLTVAAQGTYIGYRFLAPRDGTAVGKQVQVGHLADFPIGSVTFITQGSFFLVRLDDGGLVALSNRCPHLGCTVMHDADRDLLACSCHASTFRPDGQVLNPPATRPLDWYPITFDADLVLVDTSVARQRATVEATHIIYPPGGSS